MTVARPSRRRRLLFALLPTLVLALVVETVARVVCHRRFAPFDTSIRVQGDARWRADPSLIWANRPGYLEYDGSAQYNEQGLRVAPGAVAMPPKAPDELRILLLGGSAMAGVGSSQQGDWLRITGISTHPIEQSIDGHLERLVQQALPTRTVSVWNAAVASHALVQSHHNYHRLRALAPDWIVSLDGVNEPHVLQPGETPWSKLEGRWQRHPVNRWPFRLARLGMRNLASVFLAGEWVFFRTGVIRTTRDAGRDIAVHDRWRDAVPPPRAEPERTVANHRAVDAFVDELRAFHETLVADGQKHLLLVQPHLSLRDPVHLDETERALYHYWMQQKAGAVDGFMRDVHARVRTDFADTPSVRSLADLHHVEDWVFLDYCHLTATANRLVAEAIAATIVGEARSAL